MTVNDVRIYGLDGKSYQMLTGGRDLDGMIDRGEGKPDENANTSTYRIGRPKFLK